MENRPIRISGQEYLNILRWNRNAPNRNVSASALHGKPMSQRFNRPFDRPVFVFFFCLIFHPIFSWSGELYRWVDEEGIVHVTDMLSQIPPQYQPQVEKKTPHLPIQADVKPDFQSSATHAGPDGELADLKHFEVPYQAFEGASRRIIIPVTLNESVSASLLLDTGSPGLMISPNLASQLGLLNDPAGKVMVMAGGIGGSVPAILTVVDTLKVGEARSDFAPAVIAKMPSTQFEGLVGMDFMANYRIRIDVENSVVTFDELPPQPDRPGGHDEVWWRSTFRNFESLKTEWGNYLRQLATEDLTSSERNMRAKTAKIQYEAADELCRKLERYARDNAVPIQWRH